MCLVSLGLTHISRSRSKTLTNHDTQAAAFPVEQYDYASLTSAFKSISQHWPRPESEIRVAVWNAAGAAWKGFLDLTEQDVRTSVDVNIVGAFAFAREAILAVKDLELDDKGKRGTLIFTSATAALRGNVVTSSFAAGKFGQRALSQSLNKEFGKQNIHVRTVSDSPSLSAHADSLTSQVANVRKFINPEVFVVADANIIV